MNRKSGSISPITVVLLLLVVLVIPFLPLLITREWGWWEAWVFGILWCLGFFVSRALAARRHPDILTERANFMEHEDTQPWDKLLSPLVGLGSGLIPLAAGLDRLVNGANRFSLPVEVVALVLVVAGYIIASYALIENRFFSGTVRLQSDRGHRVVSSGPYRWVRHPGYLGSLLSFAASPLFLDSLWAFIPALLIAVALFVRTRLEDRFLQGNLEGYCDYVQRVPYRLIPGVW